MASYVNEAINAVSHPAPYVITHGGVNGDDLDGDGEDDASEDGGGDGDGSNGGKKGGGSNETKASGWRRYLVARNVVGVLLVVAGIYGMVVGLSIRPTAIGTLVWLGLPVAFLMAVANGANDIANSMGTSVGAKALTLNQALLSGAVLEFLGAMTMGQFVSKTISKGVLRTEEFEQNSGLFALAMFSVLVAAAVTTMIATVYGYPISATHSIIGGLIATGLAAKGKAAVDTGGVTKTCVAWVASPLLGMLVAGIFYCIITKQVLQAVNPGKASESAQYVFVTLTVAVASSFILMKGPKQVQVRPYGAAVGVALGIGVVCAVGYYAYHRYQRKNRHQHEIAAPGADAGAKAEAEVGEVGRVAVGGGGGAGAAVAAAAEDGDGDGNLAVRTQSYTTAMGEPSTTSVAESSADQPSAPTAATVATTPTTTSLSTRAAQVSTASAGGGNLALITEARDQLAEISSPSQVPVRFRLPSLGLSPSSSRAESPPDGGRSSPSAHASENAYIDDNEGDDTTINNRTDSDGDGDGDGDGEDPNSTLDADDLARATAEQAAEQPFVPLLVLSALSVAFAHGGNDVGNAVGQSKTPLATENLLEDTDGLRRPPLERGTEQSTSDPSVG